MTNPSAFMVRGLLTCALCCFFWSDRAAADTLTTYSITGQGQYACEGTLDCLTMRVDGRFTYNFTANMIVGHWGISAYQEGPPYGDDEVNGDGMASGVNEAGPGNEFLCITGECRGYVMGQFDEDTGGGAFTFGQPLDIDLGFVDGGMTLLFDSSAGGSGSAWDYTFLPPNSAINFDFTASETTVEAAEPPAWPLLGAGLLILLAILWRRREHQRGEAHRASFAAGNRSAPPERPPWPPARKRAEVGATGATQAKKRRAAWHWRIAPADHCGQRMHYAIRTSAG
ncbi:MAG: MYXO-CTERM sorting domain-containing protein [Terriglobales bacterium]